MSSIGVINEQGYVAGNGLGFEPIKEEELDRETIKEKVNDSSKETK